ncbi:cytochrome P450 monooxygenase [Corynespora cassiicola Philippines]|uniref:Cytochrome P450 monooxygenase n=1 Tax=Corynespora cassiicola Philippines TaxID=1448308 RepID=A0A2T2NTI5_CORCC|nr:cytochrome P450 monooxygenase [Corynespora cassiicola Philippines]
MSSQTLLFFLSGIASHWCYFYHFEHHLHAIKYVSAFCLLSVSYMTDLIVNQSMASSEAILQVFLHGTSYLCGLYTSTIVYRLVFHPLRKFPGPSGARLSNLWLSFQAGNRDLQNHFLDWHTKYGYFLRIGSNDLSITHPKAPEAIYGAKSRCTKADWYDSNFPEIALSFERDRDIHDKRRRVWSKAFGEQNLRGYEQRIQQYQDNLLKNLADSRGSPLNMTKMFNFLSFDIMGELAFSRSFDMLKKVEEHWAIKILHDGIKPVGYMLPQWVWRILVSTPFLSRDNDRLRGFVHQSLEERMSRKPALPDISNALLAPFDNTKPGGKELLTLQGDTHLIIIAGSDTTATTLASIFYLLARHPQQTEILRNEVTPFVGSDGKVEHRNLQNLRHLNAVINEALRLFPPVPVYLPRLTPSEGIQIEDTYIPGKTVVYSPLYVVSRSKLPLAVYKNAHSFTPERWYPESDMIKEKSAFLPFLTGTYGCIGKPLALMSLRTTVAKVVANYDFEFPENDNGESFERDFQSAFVAMPGEVNLRFYPRNADN